MHLNITLFEELAGPFATVIAAAAAAFVTFKIQNENRRLKRDELRLALFDRRYSIYAATIDYIRFVKSRTDHDISDELPKSQAFARIVKESAFICSPRTQSHLEEIEKVAFDYVGALEKIKDTEGSGDEYKVSRRERREIGSSLDRLQMGLPRAFEKDLRPRYLD